MKVQRIITLKNASGEGSALTLTLEDEDLSTQQSAVKVEYAGMRLGAPRVTLTDLREAVSLLEAQGG